MCACWPKLLAKKITWYTRLEVIQTPVSEIGNYRVNTANMGIQVNNSIPALGAQRQVQDATRRLTRGLNQLASGLRIDRASVDAAGLAIAERFRTQVRQFNQEAQGLQTGINLVQTAESALSTQQDAIGRIRELAVQASSGILTDTQRSLLNEEAQQLVQQIDQTGQDTSFNGLQVLDGSTPTITLDPAGSSTIDLPESTAASLGVDTVDLSTQAGASAALDALDTASTQISQSRAGLGAQENGLSRAIDVRNVASVNQAEAESRIRDLDIAQASVSRARDQLLQQAAISALAQANVQSESASRLLLGG